MFRWLLLFAGPILLSGCIVGTVVGTVADVAIEVVKVPFKVGGAVIDAASDDEDEDKEEEEKRKAEAERQSQAATPR